MAFSWFIRLDGAYDDNKSLIEHLSPKAEAIIVYQHPPDKGGVHIHAVFERASFTKQTFYNNCKKLSHITSNRQYTCKELKSASASISYMTKGSLDPSFVKNYSSEIIEIAKSIGFDRKKKQDNKDALQSNNPVIDVGYIKESISRITTFQLADEIATMYLEAHRSDIFIEESEGMKCLEPMRLTHYTIKYDELYKITRRVCKTYKKGGYDVFIQRLMEDASANLLESEQWARLKHRFNTTAL